MVCLRAALYDIPAYVQAYEHEQKKHRETEELRAEEAQVQQQEQRLRQVCKNVKTSTKS